MGLPKRKSATPIPDPDVISLDPDPDVISLAGQEDPDVISLTAPSAKTSLTTPVQPVHTESSGDLRPRSQGPIPPLEYPHTPKAGMGAPAPAPAAQSRMRAITTSPFTTAEFITSSPGPITTSQQIEILPRLESTSPIPAPPHFV
jgi:hypothetical protein